jgi:hypothetical protein
MAMTKSGTAAALAALVIAAPAMACNGGDPLVEVIAPFVLYGAVGGTPLGHFEPPGEACIDNGMNRAISLAQGWTFVYFKQGLRDFEGIASL